MWSHFSVSLAFHEAIDCYAVSMLYTLQMQKYCVFKYCYIISKNFLYKQENNNNINKNKLWDQFNKAALRFWEEENDIFHRCER